MEICSKRDGKNGIFLKTSKFFFESGKCQGDSKTWNAEFGVKEIFRIPNSAFRIDIRFSPYLV